MESCVGDNIPPDLSRAICKIRSNKGAVRAERIYSNDNSYIEKIITRDNQILVVKIVRNSLIGINERKLSYYASGCPYVLVSIENGNVNKYHYLFLEYMSGKSLKNVIENEESYGIINNTIRIFCIFRCILKGIVFLHKIYVAHRDIKPDNILFPLPVSEITKWNIEDNDDVICKISDIALGKCYKNEVLKSRAGTLEYMAPEILRGDETYDSSVDIWSLGVVFYQVVNRSLPFEKWPENNQSNQLKSIEAFINSEEYQNLQNGSGFLDDIVYRCLQMDPSKRPSAEEALILLQKAILQGRSYDLDSPIPSYEPLDEDYVEFSF